jgi:thiol-disulfide isomerase/thioredoxin
MFCLLVASFFAVPPGADAQSGAQKRTVPAGELPYTPRNVPFSAFKDEHGRSYGLGNFKGQVVLVNFWATWCGPCVEEMPALNRLQAKYADKGFRVVAISQDESMQSVHSFFAKKEIKNLQVFMDENAETFSSFGFSGLPTSVLIDHNGKEAVRFTGLLNWESPSAYYVVEDLLKRRNGEL